MTLHSTRNTGQQSSLHPDLNIQNYKHKETDKQYAHLSVKCNYHTTKNTRWAHCSTHILHYKKENIYKNLYRKNCLFEKSQQFSRKVHLLSAAKLIEIAQSICQRTSLTILIDITTGVLITLYIHRHMERHRQALESDTPQWYSIIAELQNFWSPEAICVRWHLEFPERTFLCISTI